jgi:hypothetical protein
MEFFELLESYGTRIALEKENKRLLHLVTILKNQIKSKRQKLYYQELVGPFL